MKRLILIAVLFVAGNCYGMGMKEVIDGMEKQKPREIILPMITIGLNKRMNARSVAKIRRKVNEYQTDSVGSVILNARLHINGEEYFLRGSGEVICNPVVLKALATMREQELSSFLKKSRFKTSLN